MQNSELRPQESLDTKIPGTLFSVHAPVLNRQDEFDSQEKEKGASADQGEQGDQAHDH